MKEYNSNYLGLVINSNDPEHRGRVQVFVPHVMPALYKGWNKDGKDITLSCVGDNIPDAITSDLLERLVKILPWAEAASPIIGSSAPGNLISSVVQSVKEVAGAVASAAGSVFAQTPSTNPVKNTDQTALLSNAAAYGNVPLSTLQGNDSTHRCAQGARQVIGALTNNNYFKQGLSSGGSEKASSLTVGGGNNYLQTSGMYNVAESVPANYDQDPSQWKIGDVRASNGGDSSGNGHVQVWTGKAWVSDFTQQGVGGVSSRYGNQTLVRMNSAGSTAAQAASGKNELNSNTTKSNNEGTSESAKPAAVTPLASPEGKQETATPPTPAVSGGGQGITSTVSGGGTVTTGNSKLAADRNARFAQELDNNPQLLSRLTAIAKREVGTSPTAQTAFFETVFNRAQFRTKKNTISEVINDPAYYAGDVPPITSANTQTSLAALQSVKNGSNVTMMATDNASNQVNKNGTLNFLAQSRIGTGNTGNWFKNGVPVSPQEAERLGLNSSKTPNGYEFLYANNGTGGTREGRDAVAYAKANGLTTSSSLTVDGQPISANVEAATASSPTSTSVVNNTDGHGRTVIKNTNDMAKGLFAYPNPGAMVWVFFREGNPLYPVYFAASYSASEWSSAYRGNSESDGYANNPNINSRSTHFNPNEAGGLSFNVTTDLSDTSGMQDEASVMLYGDDGSNMTLSKGYHQIYTRHNRRDQVDSDRFVTTGGYHEEWIQGDSSKNVRGNIMIKIGDCSQEAVEAARTLAEHSKKMNDIATKSS